MKKIMKYEASIELVDYIKDLCKDHHVISPPIITDIMRHMKSIIDESRDDMIIEHKMIEHNMKERPPIEKYAKQREPKSDDHKKAISESMKLSHATRVKEHDALLLELTKLRTHIKTT